MLKLGPKQDKKRGGAHQYRLIHRQSDMVLDRRKLPLASLPLLQPATIVSLPEDYQVLRRLTSYGLIPGVEVVVERRVPAFIIALGATRIALDHQTAVAIVVQATNP